MLERINTLWFGDRLGYLEQLSIVTAMKAGHPVIVYSYDPQGLAGVPDGAEVRDAMEVMDDPRRIKLFSGKFKALGSNFFRYELFAKELGYWMDLDVILLKPLDYEQSYVFGWEHETSINTAILRLPKGSAMLEELRNIPEHNWLPPYFGPKRTLMYYLKRLRGTVLLEDLPWGVAGPAMLTYLVKKHNLVAEAQPQSVFYPLPYGRAKDLYADAEIVRSLIAPETRAIHMWNSALRDLVKAPPRPGSYLAETCREFGIVCR